MNLKQRIIFFFQGKLYLKILAILLSAAAYAFCAIASTGYTNNTADYLARALVNYEAPCTYIRYDHNENSMGEYGVMSQRIIDIYEKTGIDFLYGYHFSATHFWLKNANVDEYYSEFDSNCYFVAGNQSTIESVGFEVVAGKYPEEVDEIAISVEYFEMFQKYGYMNMYSEYKLDKYGVYRTEYPYNGETATINDYSDLIGKTFVMSGDIETGEHLTDQKAIYEAKIVGIIDTSSIDVEFFLNIDMWHPAQKFYLSEAWREKFFYKNGEWNDDQCESLYCGALNDYETAYKISSATVEADDLIEELGEKHFVEDVMDVNRALVLLDGRQETYLKTFKTFAVPLAVLSVFLQILTTMNSLWERRKQIGILQSLGARRGYLFFLFLTEALALGVLIFAIAAPLSYEVFMNAVRANLYNHRYMVYLIEFNFLSFVLVGALSLGLPLITTALCVPLFLRRAPIDNVRKFKIIKPPRITIAERKRRHDLKKLQKLKDKYEKN